MYVRVRVCVRAFVVSLCDGFASSSRGSVSTRTACLFLHPADSGVGRKAAVSRSFRESIRGSLSVGVALRDVA